jgi:AbrB family looped-hinge helix DNA binding protein
MPADSATVTSKGQITIPKTVRDRLRLEAGDRVVFVVQGADVILKPAKTDVRDLYGMLQRRRQRRLTVEEMDDGIAASVTAKHRRR